jgi:hypothetical protein
MVQFLVDDIYARLANEGRDKLFIIAVVVFLHRAVRLRELWGVGGLFNCDDIRELVETCSA